MDGIKALFMASPGKNLFEEIKAEEKRRAEEILKIWENSEKGPKFTDEELDVIRKWVASGRIPRLDDIRRLVQTIDALRLGFAPGLTEKFPPLFTRVFVTGVDTDVYMGEVITHQPDGTIKVKTMAGGEFVEETWRNWFDREEFKKRYGEDPVEHW